MQGRSGQKVHAEFSDCHEGLGEQIRCCQPKGMARSGPGLTLNLSESVSAFWPMEMVILPPVMAVKSRGRLTSFLSLIFLCSFRFYQIFSNLIETLTPS